MRCEHTRNAFSTGGSCGAEPRLRTLRCSRKAKVLASIPYGENSLEYRYCREDGDRRASDVLANRGKIVVLTDLPDAVQLRDARGRFARAA